MVEVISKEDSAWLAGMIEGDGSLYISRHMLKNSVTFRTIVSVTNTDARVIRGVSEIFYKLGCKFYYQVKKTKNGFALSVIAAGMGSTNKILDLILPHLRAKKDQAELLREFNDKMGQGKYQRNGIEWYKALQLEYIDKLLSLRVNTINLQRLQRTASQVLKIL